MSTSSKPVALIIGASRGIGRQIAIDLAKAGYSIIVSAKSTSDPQQECQPFPPDPNSSSSTINTVAREIVELLGDEEAAAAALAIQCDVRSYEEVKRMVREAVEWQGRIDVVVYNSGAIWWSSIENTPMKRFQLMQKINPEGLYGVIQEVLAIWRRNSANEGRIVAISPPIYSRFVKGKTAYAAGKFGMSVLTMGLAVDFEREGRKGMAITSLWPAAAINSAATQANTSLESRSTLRHPSIFSDAILAILKAPTQDVNGKLLLDEDFLREHEGMKDFSKYALVPGSTPRRIMPAKLPDLSVAEEDDEGVRVDSVKIRAGKL